MKCPRGPVRVGRGRARNTPPRTRDSYPVRFQGFKNKESFDSFSWERSGGTYESQSVGAHLVSGMEIHEKKDTFCEKYLGFRAKFLCLQITAWASSSAMTLQVRIPLRVADELQESTLLTWDTCDTWDTQSNRAARCFCNWLDFLKGTDLEESAPPKEKGLRAPELSF